MAQTIRRGGKGVRRAAATRTTQAKVARARATTGSAHLGQGPLFPPTARGTNRICWQWGQENLIIGGSGEPRSPGVADMQNGQ